MASTRKREARFGDRAELLDFLLEVTAVTSSTIDLDDLLHKLTQIIRRVVPVDLFAILLYSDVRRGLRIRHSVGHREDVIRNLLIPLDEGITGIAASARMPMLVNDVRTNPHYLHVVDAVRSELAVPMVARGRLVGVIDLQSTRLNAYTPEDSALVQLVASRVASSILNARAFRQIERQNRTLRTLTRLSQQLSSILELDELLNAIATSVRGLINYDSFGIFLLDAEREVLRHKFSLRYDERVNLDNIPLGSGITGNAARDRQIIRVEDTQNDPRYIEVTRGIRSEISVPLIHKDKLVGIMDLESERVGFFTQEHEQTLQLLAPLIAQSLVNAKLYDEIATTNERMEYDLAAAREAQSLLLPREAPQIPGLDIAVLARPAHEISGDVYDFVEHGDEYSAILFGDVSGKSAAAALYGAMVSGLFRTIAPRRRSPAQLMTTLNRVLLERRVGGRYLTLIVMLWDPATGAFTISNAGNTPPLVVRGGEVIMPHLEGVPLGLLGGTQYDETAFQTQPGDLVVLYSDGIQDQTGPDESEYGILHLAPLLKCLYTRSVQEIAEGILADVDRYRQDVPIADDQTLVIIKVKEPTPA
ncbi:MAG: SpoIIE family protein phosphatase [Bryobacterales bacterium]|nr:SpoIIE family protein phosphatase [Bryobacterales bacterium]